jgi:hypothetical protein
VVADVNGIVYRYDPSLGTFINAMTGFTFGGQPVVASAVQPDDTIVVANAWGQFFKTDAGLTTSTVQAGYGSGGPTTGHPDGSTILVNNAGVLYCIDPSWTYFNRQVLSGFPGISAVAVQPDGRTLVGTPNGIVYQVDPGWTEVRRDGRITYPGDTSTPGSA